MTRNFEVENRAIEAQKTAGNAHTLKPDWNSLAEPTTIFKRDHDSSTQNLVRENVLPRTELIGTRDVAETPQRDFTVDRTNLSKREQFNNMIQADGQTVFGPSKRGSVDFFNKVDGKDDVGIFWNGHDGALSKKGIASFLADTSKSSAGRFRDANKENFVESLKRISQNWDSPEMTIYKDSRGNMTRESFAKGMQSLPERQAAVATAVIELDKKSIEKSIEKGLIRWTIDLDSPFKRLSVEKAPEDKVPSEKASVSKVPGGKAPVELVETTTGAGSASLKLNEEVSRRAEVRKGEGPYQVAARILSTDGKTSSQAEVMALTRAMQVMYREENPKDQAMAGLKVKHILLSPEKANKLMEKIADPKIRESVSAKIFKKAS